MMKTFKTNSTKLWEDSVLRPYLGEIKKKYGIIETLALPSMRDIPPVRIETLFVPPLLTNTPINADTDPQNWPKGQNLFEALEESRQLIVLGDPGGGKTTLSNWLAWRLSVGLNTPLPGFLDNKLPIPCVLREMPQEAFFEKVNIYRLASLISEKLVGKDDNLLLGSIYPRIDAGDYVLILDGLDEIPVERRKAVANWIKRASIQGACVFGTSRIVGYEDYPVDRELPRSQNKIMEEWLSLSEKKFHAEVAGKVAEFSKEEFLNPNSLLTTNFIKNIQNHDDSSSHSWAKIKYLMPFDQSRISIFSENWYRQRYENENEAKEKTKDFLSSLSKSEVTQRLARTPNLLSLMAIVHRERMHLPDGKAELYEDIANAYINTIDKQRKILPGDVLINYPWKIQKAWLAYLGFQMQLLRTTEDKAKAEGGVLATESQVLKWISEAMKLSNVDEPNRTAKVFLEWVARRSGLLLPRGEKLYAFVHLSFQEFFCASYLNDKIVSRPFVINKLPKNEKVNRENLYTWSHSKAWHETFIYLFELLSVERDPDWGDFLADILFGDKKNSLMHLQQALLATRAICDRHVKLNAKITDNLANACIPHAYNEWEGRDLFGEDANVLALMTEVGYVELLQDSKDNIFPETLSPYVIKSLSQVRSNSKIRMLIAHGKNINEILKVGNLKNLLRIDLIDTSISDLKPLAKLKKLNHIKVVDTPIRNLDALSGLTYLSNVAFRSIGAVNLSPLSNLTKLKNITISDSDVTDLKPLANLINLKFLSIVNAGIQNLDAIAGLNNLRTLDLSGNPLVNIDALKSLSNLFWVELEDTPINDIDVLANKTELKWLNLAGTEIETIEPLSQLDRLDWLQLDRSGITSIEPLKHTSVGNLSAAETRIRNIDALANHQSLRSLDIAKCKISDISPIAKCENLYRLDISGTDVLDISPLSNLKSLTSLNINNTNIKDLSPLAKLQNLELHFQGKTFMPDEINELISK